MRGMAISLERFSALVVASGLVESTAIAALQNCFTGETAREFGDYLVANEALTRWQADMICEGKYKGFIFEGYKLLDHIGPQENTNRYRAMNLRDGKIVLLSVAQRSTDGKRAYTVEPE